MVYFNITLTNPWADADCYKHIKEFSFYLVKKILFSIKFIKIDRMFRIEFEYRIRTDFPGFNLELGLLGYEAHLSLYDHRIWNVETQTYEN